MKVNTGPSGRDEISLQKVDSLLIFEQWKAKNVSSF
jgi:hypothetical protein